MKMAKRIEGLPPYLFVEISRKIAERRARGEEVISFGIGDPDTPTPAHIIDRLCQAARDPANHRYPMPLMAKNRDEVFVGRLRRDESVDHGLNMWVVADNLRKGAATNAVQIAEYLMAKSLLPAPASV